MSTFAVFGMTRAVALAEAKKKTPTVRANRDVPGGKEMIPLGEWLDLCERAADKIMEGNQVRQLSVLFDAPPVRRTVHHLGAQGRRLPRHAHPREG